MSLGPSGRLRAMTNTEMRAFDALIGAWETEAKHPMLPGTVVRGRATFESSTPAASSASTG
jgi:hypothetical protein